MLHPCIEQQRKSTTTDMDVEDCNSLISLWPNDQNAAPMEQMEQMEQSEKENNSTIDNNNDFSVHFEVRPGDRPLNEEELIWQEDLCSFYTRNILRDKVAPYVEQKRQLSERDMNWAAINYFPNNPVDVVHPDYGYPVSLHIAHLEYTEDFKRYMFDPFKRVDRTHTRLILVCCDEDPSFCLETTIAQLIWYRFAIRYTFIEECEKHIDAIKEHWASAIKKRTAERNATKSITGKKAKRAPLVKRPQQAVRSQLVRGPIKINF